MVKICSSSEYPIDSETKYAQYFGQFSFPLSIFQKWAIEGIVEKQHVLITAHTGSGKTLPAEFAIRHMVNQGKKVIYTSPIKALSNQKYHEFTQKFPDISFGILTGDIKTNPEADVIIMTTEILRNKLMRFPDDSSTVVTGTHFDMDIANDLGCVIFDEVHYINDKSRGVIWEESIMTLPRHIQMVMLSATIDSPHKFGEWCESCGEKEVYLTSTYSRPVPLTHYAFISGTQSSIKAIKNKEDKDLLMSGMNKMVVIQKPDNSFSADGFVRVKRHIDALSYHRIHSKAIHILNSVADYMATEKMLPAICFVFSRKMLERYAECINVSLIRDDDDDVFNPIDVGHECEHIIRKLGNYEEYMKLPEYHKTVALLQKGIAIHHAGMLPILREMVELMFARGIVKLLFATETFAVGINMPTKTTVFTSASKFDGNSMRQLLPHEYTQMAGRAGRRGMDTVGHVIHLPNIFHDWDSVTMKHMMTPTAQKITSGFKISPEMIIGQLGYSTKINADEIAAFSSKSLFGVETHLSMVRNKSDIDVLVCERDRRKHTLSLRGIPLCIHQEYLSRKNTVAVNKKKKENARAICVIEDVYPNIALESNSVVEYEQCISELEKLNGHQQYLQTFVNTQIHQCVNTLVGRGFAESDDDGVYLTKIGRISTIVHEIPGSIMAELFGMNFFDNLSTIDIVSIFSVFTNVVCDTEPLSEYKYEYEILKIQELCDMWNVPEIPIPKIVGVVKQWCACENEVQCKEVIQICAEKGVFLGEFVKALLKIVNIARELESVGELMERLDIVQKMREIPTLLMKHVVTNASLYI